MCGRITTTMPDYRVFKSEPQALRHVGGVMRGVAAGDSAAIIQLAVLLLIATPVARVVFALIAFGIERDKLYIAVSASGAGGAAVWVFPVAMSRYLPHKTQCARILICENPLIFNSGNAKFRSASALIAHLMRRTGILFSWFGGAMRRFQGKVAIVTGAGSGIGQGIAKRLGCEGAKVIVDYVGSPDGAK